MQNSEKEELARRETERGRRSSRGGCLCGRKKMMVKGRYCRRERMMRDDA